MSNNKLKVQNTPLVALIIFLAPLVLLIYFLGIYGIPTNLLVPIILFLFIYASFMIAFYQKARDQNRNQGYYLLILLLIDLSFLLIFFYFFSIIWPIWPAKSYPTPSLPDLFTILAALSLLSFLAYFLSLFVQEVLIQVFRMLHKLSYELQYNQSVSIEVHQKEITLDHVDFCFTSFNRYLKVQMIWALISVVFFPISLSFNNLSDYYYLFSTLGYIMLIFIMVSIPVGFVQYRNYKKNVIFELKVNYLDKDTVGGIKKEIIFAEDLLSFLKISLLLGSITKLFDILNLFNTIEEDIFIRIVIGITFFFLEYSFMVINLFFIQISHNFIASNKKIREMIKRLIKKITRVVYYPLNSLEKAFDEVKKSRAAIKEKKSKLFTYLFFYPFSFLIDIFLFYIALVILGIEFFFLLFIFMLLLLLAFLFGIIHFPLVLSISFIAYNRIRKKKSDEIILS